MTNVVNEQVQYALGRIEALLEQQGKASTRVEASLHEIRRDLNSQGEKHEMRLRQLEASNPAGLREAHSKLDERVRALERENTKYGVWSGLISSVGVAAIIEIIKRWSK